MLIGQTLSVAVTAINKAAESIPVGKKSKGRIIALSYWNEECKKAVRDSNKARNATHKNTRRMAIANGTCVSFCNQLKAHFGLPWVRLWDNRGKCHMDGRGFNAGQTHSSMYPSIFNRLPAILLGNCNFFLPLTFNAAVGVFPLEFREKVWSSEN